VGGTQRFRGCGSGRFFCDLQRVAQHVVWLLIFAMGPFCLSDCVDVLESADKSGVRGRMVAINLF
jgi:hypothetical protein